MVENFLNTYWKEWFFFQIRLRNLRKVMEENSRRQIILSDIIIEHLTADLEVAKNG